MRIETYKKKLEEKWGSFQIKGHYLYNGLMPFISKEARLNVMFEPLSAVEINSMAEALQVEFPDGIVSFWQQSNGCRLFFASLNVFGVQKYSTDTFEPYDLRIENYRLALEAQSNGAYDNQYVYFASLGGDYFFAYKKGEMKTIYCMRRALSKIEKTFDSFESFFDHFFYGLLGEYGLDCKKIHILPEDADIPVLAHLSSDLF